MGHFLDLAGGHSRGKRSADDRADRRPGDHVDRNIMLGQNLDNADVCKAAGAAARQCKSDHFSCHKGCMSYAATQDLLKLKLTHPTGWSVITPNGVTHTVKFP